MTAARTYDWAAYSGRGPYPRLREHGSDRGYYQHINRGEHACDDCKAAHAVAQRDPACRAEFARLRSAGVNARTAAVLSLPRLLHAGAPTGTSRRAEPPRKVLAS